MSGGIILSINIKIKIFHCCHNISFTTLLKAPSRISLGKIMSSHKCILPCHYEILYNGLGNLRCSINKYLS